VRRGVKGDHRTKIKEISLTNKKGWEKMPHYCNKKRGVRLIERTSRSGGNQLLSTPRGEDKAGEAKTTVRTRGQKASSKVLKGGLGGIVVKSEFVGSRPKS